MSDDPLKVQRLRSARVTVVRADPDTVVIMFDGAVDEQCFSLSRADFAELADRFAQDAALLRGEARTVQ